MSHTTVIRQKPLMTMRQILLMNLGFFGIQYSFGMQQTAINPIYTFLGADTESLPLLNLAGPITGLLLQPILKVNMSNKLMLVLTVLLLRL